MMWIAIRLSLRELWANKLRTILTALGIIIGVAAVIIMVTLGRGVTVEIARQFDSIGGNLLFVNPGGDFARTAADAREFDRGDIEALKKRLVGVSGITYSVGRANEVVFGSKNKSATVIGTDNEYFRVRLWAFADGRPFTDAEMSGGKSVCVIGDELKSDFFGEQDSLGVKIRVGDVSCEIIGVLAPKGKDLFGQTEDDRVIMPIKAVQRRLVGSDGINTIQIAVASKEAIEDVTDQVKQVLRERRHVSPDQPDNFTVDDIQSFSAQVQSVLAIMTLFVGAIAFVSLIVGGIGIMNIMLVSVTERTREIGIRLAIGAQERDVLMQFLIEAMILSLFGGLVGILLGFALSALATGALGLKFLPNLMIAAIAAVFSALIGVGFGFFPARRAAKLNPIEALRFE